MAACRERRGGALAPRKPEGPSLEGLPKDQPYFPREALINGPAVGSPPAHYGFSRSLSSQLQGAGMAGETEARESTWVLPPLLTVV